MIVLIARSNLVSRFILKYGIKQAGTSFEVSACSVS